MWWESQGVVGEHHGLDGGLAEQVGAVCVIGATRRGWSGAQCGLNSRCLPLHWQSHNLLFQSRELQTLHNLRKLFVQDLTARVKKVSSILCEQG